MPIRPAPTTYECPMCHWTKTVAPTSDALMPGEYFRACPQCNCNALVSRPATAAEAMLARAPSPLKKFLGLF